jgi:hypothetical protein
MPTANQHPPVLSVQFTFDNEPNMTLPMVADRITSLQPVFLYADLIKASQRAPKNRISDGDFRRASRYTEQTFYAAPVVRVTKMSPLTAAVELSRDISTIMETFVLVYGSAISLWPMTWKARVSAARAKAEREGVQQQAEYDRAVYKRRLAKEKLKLAELEAQQPKLKKIRRRSERALVRVDEFTVLENNEPTSLVLQVWGESPWVAPATTSAP